MYVVLFLLTLTFYVTQAVNINSDFFVSDKSSQSDCNRKVSKAECEEFANLVGATFFEPVGTFDRNSCGLNLGAISSVSNAVLGMPISGERYICHGGLPYGCQVSKCLIAPDFSAYGGECSPYWGTLYFNDCGSTNYINHNQNRYTVCHGPTVSPNKYGTCSNPAATDAGNGCSYSSSKSEVSWITDAGDDSCGSSSRCICKNVKLTQTTFVAGTKKSTNDASVVRSLKKIQIDLGEFANVSTPNVDLSIRSDPDATLFIENFALPKTKTSDKVFLKGNVYDSTEFDFVYDTIVQNKEYRPAIAFDTLEEAKNSCSSDSSNCFGVTEKTKNNATIFLRHYGIASSQIDSYDQEYTEKMYFQLRNDPFYKRFGSPSDFAQQNLELLCNQFPSCFAYGNYVNDYDLNWTDSGRILGNYMAVLYKNFDLHASEKNKIVLGSKYQFVTDLGNSLQRIQRIMAISHGSNVDSISEFKCHQYASKNAYEYIIVRDVSMPPFCTKRKKTDTFIIHYNKGDSTVKCNENDKCLKKVAIKNHHVVNQVECKEYAFKIGYEFQIVNNEEAPSGCYYSDLVLHYNTYFHDNINTDVGYVPGQVCPTIAITDIPRRNIIEEHCRLFATTEGIDYEVKFDPILPENCFYNADKTKVIHNSPQSLSTDYGNVGAACFTIATQGPVSREVSYDECKDFANRNNFPFALAKDTFTYWTGFPGGCILDESGLVYWNSADNPLIYCHATDLHCLVKTDCANSCFDIISEGNATKEVSSLRCRYYATLNNYPFSEITDTEKPPGCVYHTVGNVYFNTADSDVACGALLQLYVNTIYIQGFVPNGNANCVVKKDCVDHDRGPHSADTLEQCAEAADKNQLLIFELVTLGMNTLDVSLNDCEIYHKLEKPSFTFSLITSVSEINQYPRGCFLNLDSKEIFFNTHKNSLHPCSIENICVQEGPESAPNDPLYEIVDNGINLESVGIEECKRLKNIHATYFGYGERYNWGGESFFSGLNPRGCFISNGVFYFNRAESSAECSNSLLCVQRTQEQKGSVKMFSVTEVTDIYDIENQNSLTEEECKFYSYQNDLTFQTVNANEKPPGCSKRNNAVFFNLKSGTNFYVGQSGSYDPSVTAEECRAYLNDNNLLEGSNSIQNFCTSFYCSSSDAVPGCNIDFGDYGNFWNTWGDNNAYFYYNCRSHRKCLKKAKCSSTDICLTYATQQEQETSVKGCGLNTYVIEASNDTYNLQTVSKEECVRYALLDNKTIYIEERDTVQIFKDALSENMQLSTTAAENFCREKGLRLAKKENVENEDWNTTLSYWLQDFVGGYYYDPYELLRLAEESFKRQETQEEMNKQEQSVKQQQEQIQKRQAEQSYKQTQEESYKQQSFSNPAPAPTYPSPSPSYPSPSPNFGGWFGRRRLLETVQQKWHSASYTRNVACFGLIQAPYGCSKVENERLTFSVSDGAPFFNFNKNIQSQHKCTKTNTCIQRERKYIYNTLRNFSICGEENDSNSIRLLEKRCVGLKPSGVNTDEIPFICDDRSVTAGCLSYKVCEAPTCSDEKQCLQRFDELTEFDAFQACETSYCEGYAKVVSKSNNLDIHRSQILNFTLDTHLKVSENMQFKVLTDESPMSKSKCLSEATRLFVKDLLSKRFQTVAHQLNAVSQIISDTNLPVGCSYRKHPTDPLQNGIVWNRVGASADDEEVCTPDSRTVKSGFNENSVSEDDCEAFANEHKALFVIASAVYPYVELRNRFTPGCSIEYIRDTVDSDFYVERVTFNRRLTVDVATPSCQYSSTSQFGDKACLEKGYYNCPLSNPKKHNTWLTTSCTYCGVDKRVDKQECQRYADETESDFFEVSATAFDTYPQGCSKSNTEYKVYYNTAASSSTPCGNPTSAIATIESCVRYYDYNMFFESNPPMQYFAVCDFEGEIYVTKEIYELCTPRLRSKEGLFLGSSEVVNHEVLVSHTIHGKNCSINCALRNMQLSQEVGKTCYCSNTLETNPIQGVTYFDVGTDCPTGFELKDSVCKPCAEGKISTSTGCTNCAAGKSSHFMSTECFDCDSDQVGIAGGFCKYCYGINGEYIDEPGLSECKVCLAGNFIDTIDEVPASSCTKCPVGKFNDDTVNPKLECEDCAPGSIAPNEGAIECESCAPGKYFSNSAGTACTNCPLGKYNLNSIVFTSVSAACDAVCPTGTYGKSDGKAAVEEACEKCPVGKFNDVEESLDISACKNCDAGYELDTLHLPGASTCLPCSEGFFGTDATTTCTPCAAGTYADQSAMTSCLTCPAGSVTSTLINTGAISCTACEAGKVSTSSTEACQFCAPGYYQDQTGQTTCKACPFGRFYNSSVTDFSVMELACPQICPSGRYAIAGGQQTEDSACTDCVAGKYQPLAAQMSCLDCIPGYVTDTLNASGASNCTACGLGKFSTVSTTACTYCSTGLYQDQTGQTECKDCPLGRFHGIGASNLITVESACPLFCPVGRFGAKAGEDFVEDACEECAAGTYQDLVGQPSCKNCSIGLFANVVGSSSRLDCEICPDGSYNDLEGQSSCQDCARGSFSNLDTMIDLENMQYVPTLTNETTVYLKNTPKTNYYSLTYEDCENVLNKGVIQTTDIYDIENQNSLTEEECKIYSYQNDLTFQTVNATEKPPGCSKRNNAVFYNLKSGTNFYVGQSGSYDPSVTAEECRAYLNDNNLLEGSNSIQNFCTSFYCSSGDAVPGCNIDFGDYGNFWNTWGDNNAYFYYDCRWYRKCLKKAKCSSTDICLQRTTQINLTQVSEASVPYGCIRDKTTQIDGFSTLVWNNNLESTGLCNHASYECLSYNVGHSQCKLCDAGTFKAETGSSAPCENCAINTFQHQRGQSSCLMCPNGRYSDVEKLTACKVCLVGTTNVFTTTDPPTNFCDDCPAGKYIPQASLALATDAGYDECLLCPAGRFNSDTVQGVCSFCPAGKYNDEVGSNSVSACKDCPSGTYLPQFSSSAEEAQGYTSVNDCIACQAGKYNEETGQEVCVDCKAGTYGTTVGTILEQDSCIPCAVGKSTQNAVGQTECYSCDILQNEYTLVTGLPECLKCAPGKAIDLGDSAPQCTNCAVGRFASGAIGYAAGTTMCSKCEILQNYYALNEGQSACDRCAPGKAIDLASDSPQCENCALGRFADGTIGYEPSTTMCSNCDFASNLYTYGEGASSCSRCSVGTAWQVVTHINYLPSQSQHLTSSDLQVSNDFCESITCIMEDFTIITSGVNTDSLNKQDCEWYGGATFQDVNEADKPKGCSKANDIVSYNSGSMAGFRLSSSSADRIYMSGGDVHSPIWDVPVTKEECRKYIEDNNLPMGNSGEYWCYGGSEYPPQVTDPLDCWVRADWGGVPGCNIGHSTYNSFWNVNEFELGFGARDGYVSCSSGQCLLKTYCSSTDQCIASATSDICERIASYDDQNLQSGFCTFDNSRNLKLESDASACASKACLVPLLTSNAAFCRSCIPGRYDNDLSIGYEKDELACIACPAGKFQPDDGSTACEDCPAGKYNDETQSVSSDACTDCAAGTYADVAGLEKCHDCAAGQFQEALQSVSCKDCSPGQFNDKTGQTTCKDCPLGRFSDKSGMISNNCKKCETGKYEDVSGSSECKNCQAGKYNDELGKVACYSCQEGKDSIEGSIDCTDCVAGKFSPGGVVCEVCAKNYFAATAGTVSCTACETYDFTPSTGATECFARFQEFTLSTKYANYWEGFAYYGADPYDKHVVEFCGLRGFMDGWRSHAIQYNYQVGSHCDTSNHHTWHDHSDMKFGGGVVTPFRACADSGHWATAQISKRSYQVSEQYQYCYWGTSCSRCGTCNRLCQLCDWRTRLIDQEEVLGYRQNKIICRVEDEGVTYTEATTLQPSYNKYINRQQCKWYAQRQGVHFVGDAWFNSPKGCFRHGGDYYYSWIWSAACSTDFVCIVHDAE